jgi:hypothetical protein
VTNPRLLGPILPKYEWSSHEVFASIRLIFVLLGIATVPNLANAQKGEFVSISSRTAQLCAGPEDSSAGVLVIHDYFGNSDGMRESVEHLAALGYRAMAIDLYGGEVGQHT